MVWSYADFWLLECPEFMPFFCNCLSTSKLEPVVLFRDYLGVIAQTEYYQAAITWILAQIICPLVAQSKKKSDLIWNFISSSHDAGLMSFIINIVLWNYEIYFKIYFIDYAIKLSHYFSPLFSLPSCTSLHHSPTLVHVNGSYIQVFWLLHFPYYS